MTRSKSKKRTQLIAAHQRRAALQAGTSGREKKGAAEPLSTASIPTNEPCSESPPTSGWTPAVRCALAGLLLAVFVWSYWPVLAELVGQWERIPDYSHGYLVVPIALLMLWARRDRRPEPSAIVAWSALGLIVAAAVMRYFAARYYLAALDGWSILFWIAGVVGLLWGGRMLMWAAPAIAFLFFMVPLPYRIETSLAYPLQAISTRLSCFALQLLGQPAFAVGNTILLGDQTLEVARACSGMRIFFGIAALAFAILVLFRRPFWTRLLLIASVLPIALLANSSRIVATGMLYQLGYSEAAKKLSHDVAGWMMIPLAAAMFGLFLVYLDRLFVPQERLDASRLVRESLGTAGG